MKPTTLEIEFLGTGTSTGVPMLRCHCSVCLSDDPRDKRLRTSAIVRYQGVRLLIDCGPDFRTQMLRASDDNLDAVLLTHIHFDHVAGMDDLRAYCFERPMPIYARADVVRDLHQRIPYCFSSHPYPGVAQFEEHVIGDEPFLVDGVRVEPIPVMHYKLPIVGFRIGPLAYITDAKTIADDVVERLNGVPLLVINSLRLTGEHLSHMCLDETLGIIERVKPEKAYLIHVSDRMGLHADTSRVLPPNVELAYDGLIVKV
ncbi:MAG: MBL fold metallo-hydrolase [Muribaculaceae bacterium]|nr:MBL fold metallo-hydrolase [Muribaculaceae bacterium]